MHKERILNRLIILCGRREMCCRQVRDKLDEAVYSGKLTAKEVEEVVQVLVKEGFVDDRRFAGAFVRDKYRLSGWGKRKIEARLKYYCLSPDIISAAMAENYGTDEGKDCDLLEKLVERKLNSLRKDEDVEKKKIKALRFALGRGFDYADIIKILKNKVPLQDR